MRTVTEEIPIADGSGSRLLEVAAPADYALCADVVYAINSNRRRALAAALGVAWATCRGPEVNGHRMLLPRPKASYAACEYSPLLYGGAVIGELHAQGWTDAEIYAAGAIAWNCVKDRVLPEAEVAAARKNSEAPTGN